MYCFEGKFHAGLDSSLPSYPDAPQIEFMQPLSASSIHAVATDPKDSVENVLYRSQVSGIA